MAAAIDKEVHAVARTGSSSKTIVVRVVVGLILIALVSTAYVLWKRAQQFETTDDAEVDGQIYSISPRVSGHVSEVLIEDEQL